MLTYPELVRLERSLRDERVLSVYLHGASEDPAARLVWRTDLDRSVRDLRRWLAGSAHDERTAFERCLTALETLLTPFAAGLPSPGWAAFITGGTIRDAERLPVPMPTLAVWSTGMCVAPYIRALKVTRPVIVAVVDSRVARVYRYRIGVLDHLETIHAHATIDAPARMGDAPRSGFHPGVHGDTARDAVQRARAAGTDRMLREAEVIVAKHAALDEGIVIGGASRVAGRFRRALAKSVSDRVLQLESLHADATEAEIAVAVSAGASALRDAADLRHVAEIIGGDGEHDATSLGPAATRRALERRTVRELYITPRFLEDNMAEAEEAVREALDQGAAVEQLSRDAAAALDEHGGLGARLRYRVPEVAIDVGGLPHNAAARSAT